MTTAVAATAALLDVYARVGPTFVAGEGCELIAADGSRYLDFVAGIAVNALGYDHPVIRDAVTRALATGLVHVSNLYHTEPGERLAAELVARSFADRAFFCNSGAEANEAAFKFARKWSGKPGIVAFTGSFHGRLFASLAATDRPDYRAPFEPLVPGVQVLPLGDRASAQRTFAGSPVGAVIVEPVQGEGGVRPVPAAWLAFLRELCDAHGAALIFDEVQCGLGRTGTLFAHEQSGVSPDMLTLAKPLAGGLPMGAVLLTDRIAAALKPGDHATTFGGGPLVATVALDVLQTLAAPEFLAAVRSRGARLGAALRALADRTPKVKEVRGVGLMWGIELTEPAAPFVTAARERAAGGGGRGEGGGGAAHHDRGTDGAAAGATARRLGRRGGPGGGGAGGGAGVSAVPIIIGEKGEGRGTLPGKARTTALSPLPGVVVREGRLGDVPGLEVLMAPFVATGDLLPRSSYDLSRHIKEYVVVEAGGEIVASGSLKIYSPELAEIAGLAVRDDWQGWGLGRAVIDALIAEARTLGLSRVFGLTRKPAFFVRLGFGPAEKEQFPQKVWADCARCPRQSCCDEVAVARNL